MTHFLPQTTIPERMLIALAIATAIGSIAFPPATSAHEEEGHGSILIADQFNNRVIEIDRVTHRVLWHFGNGSDLPGPRSIVGVNDAERFDVFTLISGTGIPPSDPALPGCADPVNGCPDNRVLIVDHGGNILWQYGKAGITGAGPNELNAPVHSLFLTNFPHHPGAHVLITDQGNQRVILVNLKHKIVWQYGTTGVAGNGPNQLSNPNSAEVLKNGDILIADESNNRVIEVKPDLRIVQQFTAMGTVNGAAFASRLKNGDTLISDSNNNRIVEVNGKDHVVWQYRTNTSPGSNPTPLPTRALRLRNGDTLISDQFNQRVIEITPTGKIVFQQGVLNQPGDDFNHLNGPYDAKVVGDFTGITPPYSFDDDTGTH